MLKISSKKNHLIIFFWIFFLSNILLVDSVNATYDWIQYFPEPNPSPRNMHTMAYISENRSLLFGGAGFSNDETWIYDVETNTWNEQDCPDSPSARLNHAMAYIGDDKVILFGGWDGSLNYDTWIYDLSENIWINKYPFNNPSPRYHLDMAYIGNNKVLLFGGNRGSGVYDDETWIYNLINDNWTQKFPQTKPSSRADYGLAYISENQVLLFGGFDSFENLNDETWLYDLSNNTWNQKFPELNPPACADHSMTHFGTDQVLLFGGTNLENNNDTWLYDLNENNWTRIVNAIRPSTRYGHALAETNMDGSNYVVLYGGHDENGANDETWILRKEDNPLQVTLSSFTTVNIQGDFVSVNWATQSESDMNCFNIYRSEEGISNQIIIHSEPATNTSNTHEYIFEDHEVEIGETYSYWLEGVNLDGTSDTWGTQTLTINEDIPDEFPENTKLIGNFPNPYNITKDPFTTIRFSIKEGVEKAVLTIYNTKGQLLEEQVFHSGDDSFDWNADKYNSGIYLYKLETDHYSEVKKMMVIR